jgi:hypothetical protein
MDWKLIYRTPEQMATLSDNISGDDWKSHRLFWDAHGNIIFLDVAKRNATPPISRFGNEAGTLGSQPVFRHRNLPEAPPMILPRNTSGGLLAT